MRIGAHRFQIVFVCQICIRRSGKIAAQRSSHGVHDIFLPQKTMPPPRSEVADLQFGNTAQPFHLPPEFGLGPGIENIEFELAQMLQSGARLQLADGRKRIDLPHCRFDPETVKCERELPVFNGQIKVGEPEIMVEPLQKSRLENAPVSIESIARQPDQLGLVEAQLFRLLQLLAKLAGIDQIGKTHLHGAINEGKRSVRFWKMLPDELQHQQLVKICIEQGTRNRVQLPVMVMRAPGEVDDHKVLPFKKRSVALERLYTVVVVRKAGCPMAASPNLSFCSFGSMDRASCFCATPKENCHDVYTPSHATKKGRRYRYYISQAVIKNPGNRRNGPARIPACEIEELVLSQFRLLLRSPQRMLDILVGTETSPAEVHAVTEAAREWNTPSSERIQQ